MVRRGHHGDDVALDDRALEDLSFDHAGGVGAELDAGLLGRREDEFVGLLGLCFPDLDPFADADVGVLSGEPVDAHGISVPVLAVGAPDLRGGRVGALDLDDVAGREFQMEQRVRIQPGDTPTRVVRVRLCHL